MLNFKYFPSMEKRKNHCKIHKSKKIIIDTETSSSNEDENGHDKPQLQSVNKSPDKQLKNIFIIDDLSRWLKPTFEEI